MSTTEKPYVRPPYLPPPVQEETLRIRKKNGGRIVNISPKQYDPEQHELLDQKPRERVRAKPSVSRPMEPSVLDTELGRMSSEALKALPEFKMVTKPCRNKQELVQAIVEVRRRLDNWDDD